MSVFQKNVHFFSRNPPFTHSRNSPAINTFVVHNFAECAQTANKRNRPHPRLKKKVLYAPFAHFRRWPPFRFVSLQLLSLTLNTSYTTNNTLNATECVIINRPRACTRNRSAGNRALGCYDTTAKSAMRCRRGGGGGGASYQHNPNTHTQKSAHATKKNTAEKLFQVRCWVLGRV